MTVWGALLCTSLGAALGGCAVYFEVCAGAERREQIARDARLRVSGVRPTRPPPSHCRRLEDQL